MSRDRAWPVIAGTLAGIRDRCPGRLGRHEPPAHPGRAPGSRPEPGPRGAAAADRARAPGQPAHPARRVHRLAQPRQRPRTPRPRPAPPAALHREPGRPEARTPGGHRRRCCPGPSASPSTRTCRAPGGRWLRARASATGPCGTPSSPTTGGGIWPRALAPSPAHLEAVAAARGEPGARLHLLGHSMGGLVVRHYLRYGGEEPAEGGPVTWAGARRVASALLVATPNAGALPALGAILEGTRVGMSYTTLAATVVARMPSIYQLLPPMGTSAAAGPERRPGRRRAARPRHLGPLRLGGPSARPRTSEHGLGAGLRRGRARPGPEVPPGPGPACPSSPCPVPVTLVGGDCLPTLSHAVVGEGPRGTPPRFEPGRAASRSSCSRPATAG